MKSLSVSPVLSIIPGLDDITPILWEDLTDEEKEEGVEFNLSCMTLQEGDEITLTITPTPDWYAYEDNDETMGDNPGDPVECTATATYDSLHDYNVAQFEFAALSTNDWDDNPDKVLVTLYIESTR